MEKTFKYISLIFLYLLGFSSVVSAQEEGHADIMFTLPELAMVDIEPGSFDIQLSLSSQTEAGLPIEAMATSENKSLWLNYTSSLATGSNNRKVSIQIINGRTPEGILLVCEASRDAGNGRGDTGYPTGQVYVSNSPQTIISGIGRCFTGNGENNGHQLTYSLVISDYAKLNIGESITLQIVYTISDN